MALTIRKDPDPIKLPGLTIRSYEIDFDSSYPTGGEAWDLSADFDVVKAVIFESKAGYTFELTSKDAPASSKVKALAATRKYTATFDAASLAAATARDDAITVTGVASTDEVVGWQGPAAADALLEIKHARVTSANTITVRFANQFDATTAIDAASGTYTFYVRAANGADYEIPDTTDLSAVTKVGVVVIGKKS